jgi:hypothetical protein
MPMLATEIGIGTTAATIAVLVVGFFRARRRHSFPAYGWLGITALAAAQWALFHGVQPVFTYFTPIAWSAYILIADAAVLALTRRSRLHDAPITIGRMALLSIPLWLIFEAYNFRLRNWMYVGVQHEWAAALAGYVWSFATITPAIFETSDLVQALLPSLPAERWTISKTAENGCLSVSARVDRIPPFARSGESPPRSAFLRRRSFGRILTAPIRISSLRLDLRLALGILEQLGGSEMALYVSDVPASEDIRNARSGIFRLSIFCARMFLDVRHRRMARRLAEEGKMNRPVYAS